ncbi:MULTISPECIES: hypothetical protein [unclassified Marinimicrobium]|uniref:hypothetical protein n=1 Tax=Marinimicrobium TaxID=359337 RepID=UPI00257944D5|nr:MULTISPECIES: hypothetical protein [unclassified Marinimicrobium]
MNSIDLFDATCAKVLAQLYSQFPLEIEEFRDHCLGLYDQQSISDETNRKIKAVNQSIVFLKQNGYISYYGWEGHDTGIPKYNMKLTAKGLEKLRSTPDGLVGNDDDLGSALAKRVQSLKNLSVDEVVKNLVKAVFTGGA